MFEGGDPRHPLAVTAAHEHFTAILAEWLLSHPQMFGSTEARLQTLWLWHSAEESEHKNTAFDLYQALGGDHAWRLTWFRRITGVFLGDLLRQTVANLRQDGTLWQWRTWTSAARTLFGAQGLVRRTYRPWRQYLRRDFHPSQQDSELSSRWLTEHHAAYALVGQH
jgi:predicted metal-dependent hydrolase